jgi:glycosyltransferase involved in cell wall biosynthesis
VRPPERAPHAAIVSPDPSNRAGGVERVCSLLAGVLEDKGWRASIVGAPRAPSRWQSRVGLGYPVASWRSTEALRRDERFDLIVSNGFLGIGCPRHVPRVHIYHGTMVGGTRAQAGSLPLREHARRTLGGGAAEALCGHASARVVCVADAVAEEVRRYYRVRCDAVIPNGVDTHNFAPREQPRARERLGLARDGRYALFVGRFEHGKGSDILLAGARGGGHELLVAGPSAPAGATHLGILAPAQLADAYAACDCVLFPSRYEACSLVVLEALACARPLLSTRVGWMQTFLRAVPQYEQLCVRPSAQEISARLRSLAAFDGAGLIAAARAYVLEHNSLERWSRRWSELLAGVAEAPVR